MNRVAWLGAVIALLLIPFPVAADTGVLAPYFGGEAQPVDRLSLARLEIRVHLDHGLAQVAMLYVYESHDDRVLEGQYRLIIPETADLDAFAVWDDLTRIPGVIVERVKARRLFEEIAAASVDPGLLEADDEPTVVNEFNARVVPIPPFGAKRFELSYRVPAPIERGRLDFVLPLRPDEGNEQTVGNFVLEVSYADDLPITALAFHNAHLLPEVQRGDKHFTARYEGENVAIDEDLAFSVEYQLPDTTLDLVAYRDVESVDWNIGPTGGHYQDTTGYFQARVLFAPRAAADIGARRVILAVDGSLSMLGDKLNRTVELVNTLTGELAATDQVTLLYTNTETTITAGPLQAATPSWRAAMEDFLRAQKLAGGLDLVRALTQAGELCVPGQSNLVVLLSDGYPTAGELRPLKIVEAIRQSALVKNRARLFAVGIGDDANRTLLTDLSALADGHYTWCADTADAPALGKTVAARLVAAVMRRIQLLFGRAGNIVDTYPTTLPVTFAGSETVAVGRYRQGGKDALIVRYEPDGGAPVQKSFAIEFPEKSTDHEGIRRRWAKARVDELLARIRREGEKREWIDEIIGLSKRFTFVTPYTSFLAAPRALLRPRVIRPGDPILRVRTTADVMSVTAVFPFGLTAPLTYLPDEDIWQVRFLAPPNFPDGTYSCQLILIDRDRRQYLEAKSFVLDSRAPVVRPAMNLRLPAGQLIRVAVRADDDTRRLLAKLPFTASASLQWDDEAKASVGYLEIPAGAPVGPAKLEIYAEDFAFNVSRTLLNVEVIHAN